MKRLLLTGVFLTMAAFLGYRHGLSVARQECAESWANHRCLPPEPTPPPAPSPVEPLPTETPCDPRIHPLCSDATVPPGYVRLCHRGVFGATEMVMVREAAAQHFAQHERDTPGRCKANE